jgi:hypothetical protein
MTHTIDQPIFTLLMQTDSGLYSPELDAKQLTDRDALIKDILDGQWPGEFISLLQSERTSEGKLMSWDVSSEVTEAMEEEDDEYFAPEPIGVELGGIEEIRRAL